MPPEHPATGSAAHASGPIGLAADNALATQQDAFSAHIRDPDRNPPPAGIDPRRMQVYRELFFNNVSRLLAGNFPVIRKTLADEAWAALVRRFLARHMPQFEGWFHYRNLDVSSLKELARRWHPEVYRSFTKHGKHEALADILESINELKHYRQHFLRLPE